MTNYPSAEVVSRAQLPRILSTVDRQALNKITMAHFNIHIEGSEGDEEGVWYAGDGKALGGHQMNKVNQKLVS